MLVGFFLNIRIIFIIMENIEYKPADEYTKSTLDKAHRYYSITEHTNVDNERYMYVYIDGLSKQTKNVFEFSKNYLIYIDYVDKTFIIRPNE